MPGALLPGLEPVLVELQTAKEDSKSHFPRGKLSDQAAANCPGISVHQTMYVYAQ